MDASVAGIVTAAAASPSGGASRLANDTQPFAYANTKAFASLSPVVHATSALPVTAPTTPSTAPPAAPSNTTKATTAKPAAPVGATASAKPAGSTTTTVAKPAVPEFRASVLKIDGQLKQKMIANGIWRAGAPVGIDDLRVLEVTYWDFSSKAQTGRLIVNKDWATKLGTVFEKLFEAKFPIRKMDPLSPVKNSGELQDIDNTRSYQTRRVNGGWSMHAYGLAVDINPAENPWVRGGSVIPGYGSKFVKRSLDAQGLIQPDSVVINAFKSIGWKWGGNWSSSKDYMHFSSNGR